MNTRRKAMDARARRGRVAKLLLAGVLFVGLFIHIGMLAGISGENEARRRARPRDGGTERAEG